MAYRVAGDGFDLEGLPSSRAVLVLGTNVLAKIKTAIGRDDWLFAELSAGNLTFFWDFATRLPPSAPVNMTTLDGTTLLATVPGVAVLIDSGTGRWLRGVVISDAGGIVGPRLLHPFETCFVLRDDSLPSGELPTAPFVFVKQALDGDWWFGLGASTPTLRAFQYTIAQATSDGDELVLIQKELVPKAEVLVAGDNAGAGDLLWLLPDGKLTLGQQGIDKPHAMVAFDCDATSADTACATYTLGDWSLVRLP